MAEEKKSEETKIRPSSVPDIEPGLLDTFGTFPVWMLKFIQVITPSFLISKKPPEKKKSRL